MQQEQTDSNLTTSTLDKTENSIERVLDLISKQEGFLENLVVSMIETYLNSFSIFYNDYGCFIYLNVTEEKFDSYLNGKNPDKDFSILDNVGGDKFVKHIITEPGVKNALFRILNDFKREFPGSRIGGLKRDGSSFFLVNRGGKRWE